MTTCRDTPQGRCRARGEKECDLRDEGVRGRRRQRPHGPCCRLPDRASGSAWVVGARLARLPGRPGSHPPPTIPMSRPPTPSQASVGAYSMHHQPQPSPAHSNASTMSQSQSQSAGPGLLASLRDSVCERPPANADRAQNSPDFGLFRAGKKLCIRCVCAWRHVRERPAEPEPPLAPRDHRRHIACPPPSSNAKLTQLVHPPSYLRHEKMADSDISLQLQEVSPVFY